MTSAAGPAESRAAGNGLEVVVDHELCSRAGYCESRYGEVFRVTGEYAEVRDDVNWPDVDRDLLRAAATGCPWMAITVTEQRDET